MNVGFRSDSSTVKAGLPSVRSAKRSSSTKRSNCAPTSSISSGVPVRYQYVSEILAWPR